MSIDKIVIGNDHVGLGLFIELKDYFKSKNIDIDHYGCFNSDRMNYPEVAFKVSKSVALGKYSQGILICGTGMGMSLAANKIKGVRAVACNDPYSAKMAKNHNNANIICLGSRVIDVEMAELILDNGFSNVEYRNVTNGISAIHSGWKI